MSKLPEYELVIRFKFEASDPLTALLSAKGSRQYFATYWSLPADSVYIDTELDGKPLAKRKSRAKA